MNYTDSEIINGIKVQDSHILEALYNYTYPKVKRIILSQGGSEEDIQDVLQDSIIALFRNVKGNSYTKRPEAKLTTYFIQICKYKWFDLLKKAGRKNIPLGDYDKPSDQELIQVQLEKAELHRKIHDVIQTLGEKCRIILELFYWEDKSMQEIAEALQMEVASVKNGKYRCMQKLREQSDKILP